VRYAVKEYACTAVDVLARRTRLAFLNVRAAYDAAPRIVEIMAEELNWSKERQKVFSLKSMVCMKTCWLFLSAGSTPY